MADKESRSRPQFSFHAMGIDDGDVLSFSERPEKVVTALGKQSIVGRKMFLFEGKKRTLNSLLNEFGLSTNWLVSYKKIMIKKDTLMNAMSGLRLHPLKRCSCARVADDPLCLLACA